MTRKQLEKVHLLKRELKMWETRLEELYADMGSDSISTDGMPHSQTNNVSSPTERKAIEIADHIQAINGKAAEIRCAVREVEIFIASIEDPLIRQILEHRCVYCLYWEDVAVRIGEGYTAESCRQMYHRFVKALPTR